MGNVFEDAFMELQTGWVESCLEALDGISVEKICIYQSIERSSYGGDVFFVKNGKAVRKENVGMSDDTQWSLLNLLTMELADVIRICEEYDRPCPTEMKLIYDVDQSTFDADYQYEPIREGLHSPMLSDILNVWMEDVQKQLDEGKTDLEIHVSEPKKKKNWLKWWKK